ncbi:Importin-7 [Halotydeus destructor]|nr:Importin-7 [Halotydeus destructor]
MDLAKIAEILKATIDPNQREAAEKQLDQVHKIIGVTPALLQVVMNNGVEQPVRQAAAIYLKNEIVRNWEERETQPGQPAEYSIHEQDKAAIRDSIIDAIVLAPDVLRVHLGTCVHNVVKHDFPGKWTGIVDKVGLYLTMERTGWQGALVALYQLVKNFEYKSHDDRGPLEEAMKLLLPMLHEKMHQLLPDDSNESLLLQKLVLKIMYAFVQYQYPQRLITREMFGQWMEIMKHIAERPTPERINQVDIEDRPTEPAWKVKKWALHFLARIFDRYGSPGNVTKEYKEFADFYIKTFSSGVIASLLKVLEHQGNNIYVSPRVLQQTLNYLTTGVNHAFTWKLLKIHMSLIVQNIVFPLLCYTDADQELWETDPQEYIRMKFDVFEDYVSPVTAAQTLLHACCKKRKDMLDKTLQFVVHVMNDQNASPRAKDGALHMVGSVADILLKKNVYKEQMEQMLAAYVFPHFENPHGYLRARSCWVLHYFADTRFQNEQNLYTALQVTQKCLLQEQDLPVKVEAAICLQALLSSQERIQKAIEPQITQIALEMIKIIKETENEDLTNVMQKAGLSIH